MRRALLLCLLSTSLAGAAGEPQPPLRPGETRRLLLPIGEASIEGVVVDLLADRSGPVTIEALSYDIDTLLNVRRPEESGKWVFLARDDDGGVATNSRLVIDLERGVRYQLQVLPISMTFCAADVEIKVTQGPGAAPDGDDAQADAAYWAEVERRVAQENELVCDIQTQLRRGDSLIEKAPKERRRLAEKAHRLAEKALPLDHLLLAQACQVLGEARYDAGEYEPARALFEQAIAIRETRLGEHSDLAASLTRLGWTLEELGDFGMALTAFRRAAAIHEAQPEPDRLEVADNIYNAGQCLVRLGRYDEAREDLERSLREREETVGSGDPSLAENYKGLGELSFWMGDYARAERYNLQALDLLLKDPAPDPFDLGVAYNDLGVIARSLGHTEDARRYLKDAISYHEQAGESEQLAIALNLAGKLDAQTGLYAEAQRHYDRAISLLEKTVGPKHYQVGEVLANRARLHLMQNHFDQARADMKRSLDILLRVDPEHPRVARALIAHASLLQETGAAPEALDIVKKVLAILTPRVGGRHPMVADALEVRAMAQMRLGALGPAKESLEQVLSIRREALGDDHPLMARALDSLGRLQAATGQPAEALDSALQAEAIGRLDLALRIRSMTSAEALRYAAVRTSGLDLAITLKDRNDDPKRVERIWDALIRSRGLVLAEMSLGHRAAMQAGKIEALTREFTECNRLYSNLRAGPPEGTSPQERRTLLDDTRRKCEGIERDLQGSWSREDDNLRKAGLADVRGRLPSRNALVAYVRYNAIDLDPNDIMASPQPAYAALVLPSGLDDVVAVALGDATAIDSAVARWRGSVEEVLHAGGATSALEQTARARGEELRRLVWDPVSAHIEPGTERIFLVADGALNLINLAALPAGESSYLVESAPLFHHLFTERTLLREAQRPGTGALIVGNPLASTPPAAASAMAASSVATPACVDLRSVRFEPLPGAAEEARAVASLWERTRSGQAATAGAAATLLVGPDATEAAFKKSAPGRRVLHLATHGFFLEQECVTTPAQPGTRGIGGVIEVAEPAISEREAETDSSWIAGLVLAGGGSGSPSDENGLLLAEEVATMDLAGVEWAVLSACETAVGEVRPGEGVFGLKSAFHVAGAASLIMSLWPVEETSTREWMESLYEGHLVMNLDTAGAVHRASLNLLRARRERGESTHPFFWGAFVATGDWR